MSKPTKELFKDRTLKLRIGDLVEILYESTAEGMNYTKGIIRSITASGVDQFIQVESKTINIKDIRGIEKVKLTYAYVKGVGSGRAIPHHDIKLEL